MLSGRATAIAKTSDGPVEMMRMFKLAKASAHQGPHPGDQPAQGRPGQLPTPPCASRWPG